MSSGGAAPRAAVSAGNARAEASRSSASVKMEWQSARDEAAFRRLLDREDDLVRRRTLALR
jgi:hypothetical protein